MFLKKYWKSNLLMILIIFLFTLFDVYGDNYWLSLIAIFTKGYFWFRVVVYIGIYISFMFFMDFIVYLFKKLFRL